MISKLSCWSTISIESVVLHQNQLILAISEIYQCLYITRYYQFGNYVYRASLSLSLSLDLIKVSAQFQHEFNYHKVMSPTEALEQ